MRALLVVNPKATTTTARGRDILVRALRSETDLTVEYTRRRGHAIEFARQALTERYDLVVTLGGDGTVNEAVNGLLSEGPGPHVPALAVVPGGSTNVFARALGLPRDWAEATSLILEGLQNKRYRTVGLGTANGRYFTFCAGFGLDAEVVRKVERARLRGSTATPLLYVRSAVTQFLLETDRTDPLVTLNRPGEEPDPHLAMVIVQNTAPWTYVGDRALQACPDASFDTGLDVLALRALKLPATIRASMRILTGRGIPEGPHVATLHDVDEFTLKAAHPLAYQVDGDYLGELDELKFTAVRNALRVVC
jgi:diacylglycerol kinase family enzyme